MNLIITSQHSSLAQSNHHLDFLHPFALFFLYFSFCAFLSVWNSFYSGCEIFGPKRVDMVYALIYLMKLGREQNNVRTTRWPFVSKSKFFFLSNQNIPYLKIMIFNFQKMLIFWMNSGHFSSNAHQAHDREVTLCCENVFRFWDSRLFRDIKLSVFIPGIFKPSPILKIPNLCDQGSKFFASQGRGPTRNGYFPSMWG